MKMMSPEVQLLAEWYDPVLLSAQKENFSGIITTHNAMVKAQKEGTTFPEEAVDAYIGQISDAIVVPDINSSIIVIMNEEMPAYFENQKSFDEVAGIRFKDKDGVQIMKDYMAIEKDYRAKLLQIPAFARWLSSKGRLINGVVK